jgi:hypothetical protein
MTPLLSKQEPAGMNKKRRAEAFASALRLMKNPSLVFPEGA